MSLLNYFDHHGRKSIKEHFAHLVQVAKVDGKIDKPECELLYRMGKKIGLTAPEIDHLITHRDTHSYTPPYELEKRFNQFYQVVVMLLEDGIVDPRELHLASNYASSMGFNEKDIDRLITLLIEGIKAGKDEEDLFKVFKKNRA